MYLKENYSIDYLKPLIVNKKATYLAEVFPYLESINVLDNVINSSSILTLTLKEIQEKFNIQIKENC